MKTSIYILSIIFIAYSNYIYAQIPNIDFTQKSIGNWSFDFAKPKRGNGTNSRVAAAIIVDNFLYMAGTFSQVNLDDSPITAQNIVKYNITNHTFIPLTPSNKTYFIKSNEGMITSLAVIGNYLYVGGTFNYIWYNDGVSTNSIYTGSIFRIDLTTNVWEALPSSTNIYEIVNVIKSYNNKLYIGGRFSSNGSNISRNICYYDPQTNNFNPLGSGISDNIFESQVNDITFIDNEMIVVGSFNNFSSVTSKNIAKFNFNTFQWKSFDGSVNDRILKIHYYNNRIYICGAFYEVTDKDGTMKNISYIASFDLTTNKWSPIADIQFDLQSNTNKYTGIYGFSNKLIIVQGYDKILKKNTLIDVQKKSLFVDLSKDSILYLINDNNSSNSMVDIKYSYYDDNNFVAYGYFNKLNDIPFNNVALFNYLVNRFYNIGSRGGNGVNGNIYDAKIFDNKLYVVGEFSLAGNQPCKNIAVYDFYRQEWSDVGIYSLTDPAQQVKEIDNKIYTIEVDSNYIYIGGEFTQLKNQNIYGLAKYDIKQKKWMSITNETASNYFGVVKSLKLDSNNLYIGGNFIRTVGDVYLKNIAMYSISENKLFSIGVGEKNGTNSTVNTILKKDNYIYVAGLFTSAGNILANNIARYNTTTNQWEKLGDAGYNGTNGEINTLFIDDNKLYVGGNFTSTNNLLTDNFAVYDLASNKWLNNSIFFSSGFNKKVNTINKISNKLFFGGDFTGIHQIGNNETYYYTNYYDLASQNWQPIASESGNGTNSEVNKILFHNNNLILLGNFESVNSPVTLPSWHIAMYQSPSITSNYEYKNNLSKNFELLNNYPNPFNAQTKIKFYLPKNMDIKLYVYDLNGKLVTNKVVNNLPQGTNEIDFDATNLSSGIYLYQIKAGYQIKSSKMILLK